MSIKDNYLLLSSKLRSKETSGDMHQKDTPGPRGHMAEGPILSGGGGTPPSVEDTAAWMPPGLGGCPTC